MTTNYPISTPDKPVAVKTVSDWIAYIYAIDEEGMNGIVCFGDKQRATHWRKDGTSWQPYYEDRTLIPPTPEPVTGYAVWKDGELMDAVMTINSEDYAIEYARTIGGEFVSFQIPRPGEKQQRRVTEDEIYAEIVGSSSYRDAAESIMALLEGED